MGVTEPGPEETGGRQPGRRLGEVAALVSAVTAVAGLLLAVFGLPGAMVASGARPPAPGSPATPGPSATAPSGPGQPATPAPPAPSGPAPGTPTPGSGTTQAPATPGAPAPLPAGWHRFTEPGLTLSGAVPDGWQPDAQDELRRNWKSPDGAHVLGFKRDSFHGTTAEAAADGQLAWYRKTAESAMEGLQVQRTRTAHDGEEAVLLTLDYHWPGRSAPRRRVELFVAGADQRVYQLLVDSEAGAGRPAEQAELFDTARGQLRTEVR
ncbi:hypothetical protein ACFV7Q_18535 [Streptomyces sp. NPDC059851]|uniref:hypothetical protein n=1 Tax=Streptomyces sp. NPDC059851 TaxID=3346971 RepID=UPI003665EE5C